MSGVRSYRVMVWAWDTGSYQESFITEFGDHLSVAEAREILMRDHSGLPEGYVFGRALMTVLVPIR